MLVHALDNIGQDATAAGLRQCRTAPIRAGVTGVPHTFDWPPARTCLGRSLNLAGTALPSPWPTRCSSPPAPSRERQPSVLTAPLLAGQVGPWGPRSPHEATCPSIASCSPVRTHAHACFHHDLGRQARPPDRPARLPHLDRRPNRGRLRRGSAAGPGLGPPLAPGCRRLGRRAWHCRQVRGRDLP